MANGNNRNRSNQERKAVDIMKRSDGRVVETTTRFNDTTIERNITAIAQHNKRASRSSISAEDLNRLKLNLSQHQRSFQPTTHQFSSPTEKPKEKSRKKQ
jgi:hypothetical protein